MLPSDSFRQDNAKRDGFFLTCKCGCGTIAVHVHIRSNFQSAPEKVVSWWKLLVHQHLPLETVVCPTVFVSLMFCCTAWLSCFWQIFIFFDWRFLIKCLIFYACHMVCWRNSENIWLLAPAVHNVFLPWGVGPPEWQPGPRFPENPVLWNTGKHSTCRLPTRITIICSVFEVCHHLCP